MGRMMVRLMECLLGFGVAVSAAWAGPNYPPRPAANATAQAQKKVEAATAALAKARQEQGKVVARLRQRFESTAEYTAAADALKRAQADLAAAKAPVISAVQAKPDYQAALVAKMEAEKKRDAVRDNPEAKPEERMAAAAEVLEKGKVVAALENGALSASQEVTNAKAALAAAAANLEALVKRFQDSIKSDPDWQTAQAAIDEADKQLAAARDEYNAARQQDAQALAEWKRQCAQLDEQWRQQQQQQQQQQQKNTRRRGG